MPGYFIRRYDGFYTVTVTLIIHCHLDHSRWFLQPFYDNIPSFEEWLCDYLKPVIILSDGVRKLRQNIIFSFLFLKKIVRET